MKVLCPSDFSDNSTTAIRWIVDYMYAHGGGELHIIHSIEFNSRADVFIKLDEIFIEEAQKNMEQQLKTLDINPNLIKVVTLIKRALPEEMIKGYAKQQNLDLIVMGSKGLSPMRDLIVGSVTEYTSRNSKIPVLVIPEKKSYKRLDKIVMGIDDKAIKNLSGLDLLSQLIKSESSSLQVAQVMKVDQHELIIDDSIRGKLDMMGASYHTLSNDANLVKKLNDYADHINADLLCIIHHKRNWLSRLISRSITKEEFYNLELPILILSDKV